MVKNYETLLLLRSEVTDDELKTLEQSFNKLIADGKGSVASFDKWGKYKLSYPIKRNVYGVYVLVRFQAPQENVAQIFNAIDMLFRVKHNDIILRHVTVKLKGSISAPYKFPESITSHGSSSLDSFLKENKMGGLIETSVESSDEKDDEDGEEDGFSAAATQESDEKFIA